MFFFFTVQQVVLALYRHSLFIGLMWVRIPFEMTLLKRFKETFYMEDVKIPLSSDNPNLDKDTRTQWKGGNQTNYQSL